MRAITAAPIEQTRTEPAARSLITLILPLNSGEIISKRSSTATFKISRARQAKVVRMIIVHSTLLIFKRKPRIIFIITKSAKILMFCSFLRAIITPLEAKRKARVSLFKSILDFLPRFLLCPTGLNLFCDQNPEDAISRG